MTWWEKYDEIWRKPSMVKGKGGLRLERWPFFCIYVRFLGFKNKAWMGRTQVFRLLKRALHTNHLNNTNLVSFLRIPWQKKMSFSIWHTQVLDWALFATNASIENLFQWRSVPIICIAVGFKDALRCPGCFGTKRWQLQITNGMLPCQHVCPSSLQGSTTKLEKWTLLILQPWLVLWWVAALEFLAPSSQAMLGRFAWCTTPVQKFNYG